MIFHKYHTRIVFIQMTSGKCLPTQRRVKHRGIKGHMTLINQKSWTDLCIHKYNLWTILFDCSNVQC